MALKLIFHNLTLIVPSLGFGVGGKLSALGFSDYDVDLLGEQRDAADGLPHVRAQGFAARAPLPEKVQ